MPFEFEQLSIPGLILVQPRVFIDPRGYFFELYKQHDFARAGIGDRFVQDNYSHSERGVLRGLHYQKQPRAQGKLVICLRGRIFDVAVDIRRGSPHFGKWLGVELSEENRQMLYVPPGFAHGFQVVSDSADVQYKCTDEYSPENDRGIAWNDPDINIAWPLRDPLLSDKDVVHPMLRDSDNKFSTEQSA